MFGFIGLCLLASFILGIVSYFMDKNDKEER